LLGGRAQVSNVKKRPGGFPTPWKGQNLPFCQDEGWEPQAHHIKFFQIQIHFPVMKPGKPSFRNKTVDPGMVTHTVIPVTWEVEDGRGRRLAWAKV
jgi:hypothetical protein